MTSFPPPRHLRGTDVETSMLGRYHDPILTLLLNSMTHVAIALLAAFAFLAFRLRNWGCREAHLPPGPPTTRFIGNILQLPSAFLHLQYVLVAGVKQLSLILLLLDLQNGPRCTGT